VTLVLAGPRIRAVTGAFPVDGGYGGRGRGIDSRPAGLIMDYGHWAQDGPSARGGTGTGRRAG
jgi:hypothetical protein